MVSRLIQLSLRVTTIHDHTTERLQETLERGLSGWVVSHRQVAVVDNTSQDKRWMPRQYEDDGNAITQIGCQCASAHSG